MLLIGIVVVAGIVSAIGTGLVRQYLVRRAVMDIPNGRSSHSVPTPRGGGLAIVAVFLLATIWLASRGAVSRPLAWALVGGGVVVGVAGLLDDHFHLSASWRLLIHFCAAGWALGCLRGLGPLFPDQFNWSPSWLLQGLGLVGIVWMINLYNFMDGIDGLAGVEAVCVSGLGGLLLLWTGVGHIAPATCALAGAAAGFLVWNWPPAKVFMGDVGSGFLGLIFAVLVISSAKDRPELLWSWLILLSVFLVDSTFTLIRRGAAGARVYQAHCTHAYQHAAKRAGSHAKVTLTIAIVNIVWLFPLAAIACVWPKFATVFAMIAVVPLAYLAIRLDAGRERHTKGARQRAAGAGAGL